MEKEYYILKKKVDTHNTVLKQHKNFVKEYMKISNSRLGFTNKKQQDTDDLLKMEQ